MIRFITLSISVVLLTGLTLGMAKSNKQQQQPETNINNTTPACPYFVGQREEIQETEYVSEFSHCKKCDTGVFLPHENNIIKCTFCGELE
jgi:hypothetical protein